MAPSILFRFVLISILALWAVLNPGQALAEVPPSQKSGRTADTAAVSDGRYQPDRPIIIAHRGASGHRPEHTLGGYTLALEQGADQIEPDLVLTADGVLVVMHDLTLNSSTDIAQHPEFADRAHEHNGGRSWYVYDFTLEELRTLRCKQSFHGRSGDFDGQEMIPTFAETVELVRAYNAEHETHVGICPELKGPAAHGRAGLDIVAALLEAVETLELEGDSALPVIVQCFELGALENLRPQTGLPLLFLSSGMPRETSWPRIAESVDYVGVGKRVVLGEGGRANVEAIHSHGLGVIAWTFRDDSVTEGYTDSAAEIREALDHGIDGLFTDFPDTGVQTRNHWLTAQGAAPVELDRVPQD